MNSFHDFELFIKRASFLCIRTAAEDYLARQEKFINDNADNLEQAEIQKRIEILWQLRDFIEIFDTLIIPK